jgi:hypothetical protein
LLNTDDFEVSIFLTPIGTRHSLLKKNKAFKNKTKISGNSNKLTGSDVQPVIIREESDEEAGSMAMDQIPEEDGGFCEDDKKKLALKTTYDGFSIWGWVLCLLVTRKGGPSKKSTESNAGQALMEEWISTQQQEDEG